MKKEPIKYLSVHYYSKRNKRNIFKRISLKNKTEDEANKNLEEFKNKIMDDNIKYLLEKQEKPIKSIDPIIKKLNNILDISLSQDTGNVLLIFGASLSGKTYFLINSLLPYL